MPDEQSENIGTSKVQTQSGTMVPVATSQAKPKRRLAKFFLLILLVLAVLALGVYFANIHKTGSINSESLAVVPPKPTATPAAATTKQIQALLQAQSKIQIPAVLSTSTIASASLPVEIQNLLPADAIGLHVYKASYSGGQTGFQITYSSNDSLVDSHNTFQQVVLFRKWTTLTSVYSILAGMIQAKNAGYTIQINQAYPGNQATGTVFTIISVVKN